MKRKISRSDISFKKASLKDAPLYAEIERRVMRKFPVTYSGIESEEEAREEIAEHTVYFIMRSGEAVGTVQYRREEKGVWCVSGLVLDPRFHGRGIGRAAMEFVLEKLKKAPAVRLVTHPRNTPAIMLYLSFGFTIRAWKNDYYGDGEPRILLERNTP